MVVKSKMSEKKNTMNHLVILFFFTVLNVSFPQNTAKNGLYDNLNTVQRN